MTDQELRERTVKILSLYHKDEIYGVQEFVDLVHTYAQEREVKLLEEVESLVSDAIIRTDEKSFLITMIHAKIANRTRK